jgi:DNA polymerase I-like protein with 3'-5' exonuclease and polymerase domains
MHDTVIPAKLADPSSTGADPALKKLSPAMLGEASTTMRADAARREVWKAAGWLVDTDADTPIERNGWAQIRHDSTTMIRYAGSDVLDTAAIALKLADQLPAPHIYARERLTEAMTARVSHRGLALDVDHIRALEVKHTAAQAQAAEWIRAQGIDNPGSGPQVAAKLAELGAELPRTKPSTKHPDGQPSTAEGALDPIAQETGPAAELAQRLLAYREHTTALGLFLRPYKALCEHGDGRARPTVYTLGTNTGRMSAVRPNIQQLPRSGGFRAMVNADPGQLMISADFSGVELRVAAALSGDPELTRIIADDRDLHMEVARLVWGPDATKAHRYKAKGIDFGYLYGGGVPTLAAQAGVSHEIAQRAVDVLKTMMPTLAAWSDWMQNKVKAGETQFPTYSGRIIHLPVTRPHAAGNYGIQGTARELLVDALVKWNQTKWGNSTLVPVHDELICFVPEAEAEEATRVLVQCMETELNGVRIVAEADPPSFVWQDSA